MDAIKVTLLVSAIIATLMTIEETLLIVAGKRWSIMVAALGTAVILLWATSSAKADCGHFFSHHKQVAVVQQVVAQPYYYPPVYYSAGQDIQAEALAEKVARLVQQKLTAQQLGAPVATPPKPTALAKCAACHTGPEAAAGLVLDGSPIDCHAYFRWGQIAGQGREVPQKMGALLSRMTPEEKGAVNDALLDLVAPRNMAGAESGTKPLDGGLE